MPEDVRRLVGRNVRRLRVAAGLSQAALSERVGVDWAYVSGLERGERNPTIITLWHTAKALGVKLQELTTERGHAVDAFYLTAGRSAKADDALLGLLARWLGDRVELYGRDAVRGRQMGTDERNATLKPCEWARKLLR